MFGGGEDDNNNYFPGNPRPPLPELPSSDMAPKPTELEGAVQPPPPQAQAAAPMHGVRGLAFAGFPLHPAGKPSTDRAEHLAMIDIPTLFLQGTRDALAEVKLIEPVVQRLGPRATLHMVDGGDHSFHVLARSGRNDREVLNEILDAFAAWVGSIAN